MFITLDGPNGVGKTSVAREVQKRLEDRGERIVSLRQPSDSPLGRFVRDHHNEIRGVRLAALVVADRYLQIDNEIRPSLESGATVVLDRYVASTLVLQQMDGLDPDFLMTLNSEALVPDLAVILNASPEALTERLDRRGRTSRFEATQSDSALEVSLYDEAAEALREVGYPVMMIRTDGLSVPQIGQKISVAAEALGSRR